MRATIPIFGVTRRSSASRIGPRSARGLRVYLVCRELLHEYMDPFIEVCAEHSVNMGRHRASTPILPSRPSQMMRFAEAIPTLKVAVDL